MLNRLSKNGESSNSLLSRMPKMKTRIKIPIGAMFDIPTGSPVVGRKGETYCNGGLPNLSVIAGMGNCFKSTIGNFMLLTAASRFLEAGEDVNGFVYDTELTYEISRYEYLASRIEHLPTNILTGEDACWLIASPGSTDAKESSSSYTADLFAKDFKDILAENSSSKEEVKLENVVNPYEKNKPLSMKQPIFGMIDSLSEFNSEKIEDMLSENLDSSSTNTYGAKQGLFRSKFLTGLPAVLSRGSGYVMMVAQLGKKIDLDGNPYKPKDPGLLKFLNENQNLKGVGTKVSFLTEILWAAEKHEVLYTRGSSGDKVCQYPLSGQDEGHLDLNVIWLKVARSKSGKSGIVIPIIVSQSDGVLPNLSEFHFLMINKKYGLSGNDREFSLDIYPDVKLNRRNIRALIEEDPKLRRAINITAEMLQIELYQNNWLHANKLKCSPKALYEDIKKLGYDWDELLSTRGYWLPNQYTHPVPFLSTYDLLKMRIGSYTPYFKNKTETKANKE